MPDDTALLDRLVEFSRELRAEGVPLGSGDTLTYCEAMATLDPGNLHDLYWGGRTTLVTRRDQIATYDRVFRRFFLGIDDRGEEPSAPPPAPSTTAESQGVLHIRDNEAVDGTEDGDDETSLGLMASDIEVWRDKAFTTCTPEELVALRRIIDQMRLDPPRRRGRRRRSDRRGELIDMRNAVRDAVRHGDPARLPRTRRKLRVRPLVLILDVSGSMADHSRNLLQFAYAMHRAAGKVEVFCFGTRLTRITPALQRRRPDDAMADAAARVLDWDGGTRIGDSLDQFVKQWARRSMSRSSIVVICSDGLDRGDPAVLAAAMARIRRLCHRIVWVDPDKGADPGFRPNTLGLMVAAEFVDSIESGHNLRSLEDFAARMAEMR